MPPLPNNKNPNLSSEALPTLPSQPPPPLPAKQAPRHTHLKLFIILLVWAGLLGLLFANRQNISDWWQLRGYQPPAGISQLAGQDTMTDYARHMLYLNKPQLLSSVASFRKLCPENKDIVVLGCYHPVENGIYIYDVNDPTLSGVTQVTAAHETLHAIYGRLSTKDRQYVDGLLNDYYKNTLKDARVRGEIQQYQKIEPAAVLDEMHSTFGTEIAKLPPPLEAYYEKYFTHRSAIVNYERQYEVEFSSRRGVVQRDDRQLAAMKAKIDSQQVALKTQLDQINAQQTHLNTLRSNGQAAAYNAAVPGYNSQVDSYNQGVSALKSLIDQYNQLVAARNLVAGQLNTLDKALDTRLAPQTQTIR